MKITLNIIFFVVFSIPLKGQIYFNKLYDFDGGDTTANHVTTFVQLDSGNFLIAGHKFFPNFGALHYLKIDSFGDTIFTKSYKTANTAHYTSIGNSFIKCSDGNLAHCGTFYDSSSDANMLLVKLTNNADTLWTRNFGGSNFDNSNMVSETADSGFVLMGSTQSFGAGATDFYLVKVDKNGNFQWQQTYGTSANEECSSGLVTLDGGFILSGHRANVMYLVKTNSSGGLEWQQTYSGTKGYSFIKQLADSSYIFTGSQNIAGSGDQACMLKLNKNGGVIWQKTYGGPGIGIDLFFTKALVLTDFSIVVGGISTIGSIPIGLLVKTDSAGNQQWLRTYYANTVIDNYIYDLKQTTDNGFIFVGTGYISSQDAWVVRVDSAGCEIANCNVGISENQDPKLRINIFPNPASGQIQISIPGENLTGFDIRVSNILGKTIQVVRSGEVLDISSLSSGIYFVTTTSKDKQKVLTSKFIKE